MTCRAPSSATTCSGTPNGQALTWDVEGRLANWQNTTTSPTVTAKYLYDGEGNRVVQQVVDSTAGSTTTTSYVGSLETYSITTGGGPTGITTTDYLATGKVLAESVNGTLSYLATSYQGSVVEALDSTGAVGVIASQLYVPYGGIRYQNGALPTDYGYTGQRRDASSGLDYYGARYYDPTVGQFTSADTLLAGGLNRYGYVGGNPTTATDPSGHMDDEDPDEGGPTGDQGAPPGAFAAGAGGGGGLAAFFAWLFGEDEATSGAAAGSTVAGAGATATDDPFVIDEGSNTTATIDDGGITFTNTQTGDSQFYGNDYFNDSQDPATETPGSHYWRAPDQEANKVDPPQTTSTDGTPENPGDTQGNGNGSNEGKPIDSAPRGDNIVYRGLASEENPEDGFTARDPDAVDVDPVSHIAGKKASPWISTTKDPDIAFGKYGKNGVAAIDLSSVNARVVDFSSGIPGREGQMLSYWAAHDSEVLIFQYIPREAILWWWTP